MHISNNLLVGAVPRARTGLLPGHVEPPVQTRHGTAGPVL